MKLNLYEQSGSDNHGCEAIIRSTIDMFQNHFDSIELFSSLPESEYQYGLNRICNVHLQGEAVKPYSLEHIAGKAIHSLNPNYSPFYNKIHRNYLKSSGISLQTGGDNYCYGTQYRSLGYMNDATRKRGMKSVLWGVSISPEIIGIKGVSENLKRYDLITARESITYHTMKTYGVKDNLILCPDPAFTLKKADIEIPNEYEGAVGINCSPLMIKSEKKEEIVIKSYLRLIKEIIKKTDRKIILIPHVVVKGNDDREVLKELYAPFIDTGRVFLLDDCNCQELKAYISQCCFFVGARTHATIAAYSTCVPTLVVGYSVKAKGIAKDLFGDEQSYVLPVQEILDDTQLAQNFWQLYEKRDAIRNHLEHSMPAYIQSAYQAREAVLQLKG